MHIAINALATTNLSGWFVISGHLNYILKQADLQLTVICHPQNAELFSTLGPKVKLHSAPEMTTNWKGRTAWERKGLPQVLKQIEADVLLSLSGMCPPGLAVPVVPYAMNPWALVPGMARTPGEKIKAFLQRRGYKQTIKIAAGMAYLSGYMREAYEQNAKRKGPQSEVVYIGLDEDVLQACRQADLDRKFESKRIVTVSAMAPHKGIISLVRALAELPEEIQLTLAGGWPDEGYRELVEAVIKALDLSARVEILGHISREDLLSLYGSASVFCLMSECESFGIPSAEAQAFGTPVVTSDRCAMPEVCGKGGRYAAPGDVRGIADALEQVLMDRNEWGRLSAAAIENSHRFDWETQSAILLNLLKRCS